MKILYLIHQFFPEYYTGTEKFVFNIASMMQKGGGDSVRVITYCFYEDSFFDRCIGDILYKEFTFKGIPVTAIKHKRIPEDIHIAIGDERMTRIARHLLSIEKPDVVHVGHAMRVGEFVAVSQALGIPYMLTLTDFWLICPKVNLISTRGDLCAGPEGLSACRSLCAEMSEDFLLKRYERARDILFNAKKVLSPSEFLGGLFKRELDALNVSVVNHGMSYKKIRKNKRNYKKGDSLIFCFAGSFNDHKGVHILIDAFKMISSGNVVLKIYGSGPNPLYVNRLFDMARVDKRIEFCGVYSEEEIGDIFSKVDAVVVPSLWYENYPLVLHEALACETPVIASNIGGMAEKIKDRVNGFSFQVGDAGALRTVMERIIAEPEILNTLKNNMKSLSIPTVEQEAYAYYKLYRSITQ